MMSWVAPLEDEDRSPKQVESLLTSPKLWGLLQVLTKGGKKGVVVGEKC